MSLEKKILVCACIWGRLSVYDTDNQTKKVVWNLVGRYIFNSGGGGADRVICGSKVGRRLQESIYWYTILKKGGG